MRFFKKCSFNCLDKYLVLVLVGCFGWRSLWKVQIDYKFGICSLCFLTLSEDGTVISDVDVEGLLLSFRIRCLCFTFKPLVFFLLSISACLSLNFALVFEFFLVLLQAVQTTLFFFFFDSFLFLFQLKLRFSHFVTISSLSQLQLFFF